MDDTFAGLSIEELTKAAMAGLETEDVINDNTDDIVKDKPKDVIDSIVVNEKFVNINERYLDLIDGQFFDDLYDKFLQFSVRNRKYNEDIESYISKRNEAIAEIEIELDYGVDDIKKTINFFQEQKENIENLCVKNRIKIKDKNEYGIKDTSYHDLERLINESHTSLGISYKEKAVCKKACQESLNFVNNALEKIAERLNIFKKNKNEEIGQEKKACKLKCDNRKKDISNLFREVSEYINSKDLQEINNYWENYLDKYQISILHKYNCNKKTSELYGCIGFVKRSISMNKSLSTYIRNEFKHCNSFYMFNDENEMILSIPLFDNLTDFSNKYFISADSVHVVQCGLQSYLLTLLSNSKINEYDFVFIDPISNGKSFLDTIGLVHDDGYGIANSIKCDKNEIAKALSELSDKIKKINQIIKGYSSIYEYNKDYPNNKINTTIIFAYNFCNEYYREDLLKPIFDNADKCGITIFTVTPFSGQYSTEKVRAMVNLYLHNSILCDDDNILKLSSSDKPNVSYDFDFISMHPNTTEWIEEYNDVLKQGD